MREDFSNRLARIIGQKQVNELKAQATIAAQIIKARHDMKWSQQDLANKIGVAKSTIGRIEAGINKPSHDTLYMISKALRTPLIIDGTTQEENEERLVKA